MSVYKCESCNSIVSLSDITCPKCDSIFVITLSDAVNIVDNSLDKYFTAKDLQNESKYKALLNPLGLSVRGVVCKSLDDDDFYIPTYVISETKKVSNEVLEILKNNRIKYSLVFGYYFLDNIPDYNFKIGFTQSELNKKESDYSYYDTTSKEQKIDSRKYKKELKAKRLKEENEEDDINDTIQRTDFYKMANLYLDSDIVDHCNFKPFIKDIRDRFSNVEFPVLDKKEINICKKNWGLSVKVLLSKIEKGYIAHSFTETVETSIEKALSRKSFGAFLKRAFKALNELIIVQLNTDEEDFDYPPTDPWY